MEEKIEYKEVQDALYVLLHCSLKDKEYETQKQQFDLVMNYIDRLQKENEELKNMQCEFLGTGCKREMKELQKNYIYYKNLANEYQGSCIPKSVIQDKIEEIINNSTFGCVGCEWNDIEVVQLLENMLLDRRDK